MTFTAELGTDLSMPGNLALGWEPTTSSSTYTSIGDAGLWLVTLTESALGGVSVGDAAVGRTTVTDAGDPG